MILQFSTFTQTQSKCLHLFIFKKYLGKDIPELLQVVSDQVGSLLRELLLLLLEHLEHVEESCFQWTYFLSPLHAGSNPTIMGYNSNKAMQSSLDQ
jgi:hypothetical protein